jgi:site-specific recombinase XerD
MKWSYWIELHIRTHCVARGLRSLTLAAYEEAMKQFHEWVRVTRADIAPDQVTHVMCSPICSICATCVVTERLP